MSTETNKIAIVRLSALGDALCAVPMLRALQRHLPETQFAWFTSPIVAKLLAGLSSVDFVTLKKPASLSDYRQCYKTIKAFQFDTVCAIHASFRVNLLYPAFHTNMKLGFDKKRGHDLQSWFVNERIAYQENHYVDQFLQFAARLGVKDLEAKWDLATDAEADAWVKSQLGEDRYMVVCPTASIAEKEWTAERYAKVMDLAAERYGVQLVLAGGVSKRELTVVESVASQITVPCLNVAGKTSLQQLQALLAGAELVMAPDTGPMHLAVAVGTPVVALHASTDPALSGPYTSRELVVSCYAEAVRKYLHKDISQVPFGKRVHHKDVMQLISVEDVLEKLKQFYGSKHENH